MVTVRMTDPSHNFEYTLNGKVEHCQSKIQFLTDQICPAKRVNSRGSAFAN